MSRQAQAPIGQVAPAVLRAAPQRLIAGSAGLELGTGASAMFAPTLLIARYLAYLGAVVHLAGPLLWPATVPHAAFALLLVWPRLRRRKGTLVEA